MYPMAFTLNGTDDGVNYFTLNGFIVNKQCQIMVDFSPKGGPTDILGNYQNENIVWPDGN